VVLHVHRSGSAASFLSVVGGNRFYSIYLFECEQGACRVHSGCVHVISQQGVPSLNDSRCVAYRRKNQSDTSNSNFQSLHATGNEKTPARMADSELSSGTVWVEEGIVRFGESRKGRLETDEVWLGQFQG